MLPHQSRAWAELQTLSRTAAPLILDLFESEPGRLMALTLDVCGIHFDFSKLPLSLAHFEAMEQLVVAADLAGWQRKLASGDIVNPSENQPAGHLQLRAADNAVAEADTMQIIRLADRIRSGAFGPIRDIIHIGIGGSVLGPQLLVDALHMDPAAARVHFVSNVDATALHRVLRKCRPEETLVLAVSKTFSTMETQLNLQSTLDWLQQGRVENPLGRVVAITACPEVAREQGIAEILPFEISIGGRYSLWSAVGLPFAICCGGEAYRDLLRGAHDMDCHFLSAPFSANAPVLAAMADVWLATFLRRPTRAVFAYDERLRLLPVYLQQLEMESNGKSVARDGTPLPYVTAPIVWGGVGTSAQHAVFQLLHQGSHADPVEFLAVRESAHGQACAHHRQLLANCFAQSAALLKGRSFEAALAQTDGNRALAQAQTFPGNRGSSTIVIDRLTPDRMGALLAFYEARTFTAGILLGLNSFDQWGVELGKEIANSLSEGQLIDPDPSTASLMQLSGLQAGSPSSHNSA